MDVPASQVRRPSHLLQAAAAATAFCLVSLAHASAQDGTGMGNSRYWFEENLRVQRTRAPPVQAQRIRRLMPHRELARPTIWHERPVPAERAVPPPIAPEPTLAAVPRSESPNPPAAPAVPVVLPSPASDVPKTAPPEAPTPAQAQAQAARPAFTVAVIGDNLAQWLSAGLADAFPPADGVAVLGRARESSGLVREDFYDWPRALRELVAGTKLDAIVVMIGSNDRQGLRGTAGIEEPLSPGWEALYGHRVEALVAIARDKKVPVVWVGMPVMKSERLSADIAAINDLDRAHAEAAGARFVDVFDAFADERGQYSAFGPDVNGQTVKLRTGDGIHFTPAGARKLAHFVEGDLRRLREAALPSAPVNSAPELMAPAPPATPAAPSASVAPAAPVEAKGAAPTPPTRPAALAAQPSAAPERPAIGPVLPLTAAPTSPGGELLGRASSGRFTDAQRAASELLPAR